MRPSRQPILTAVAVLGLSVGCAPDSPDPTGFDRAEALALPDLHAEAGARIGRFAAAPDWGAFVELLAQPHSNARKLFGPHRLSYTAQFETGPEGLDPNEALPSAKVGEPILERFLVNDRLELRWATRPGEPVELRLEQHNEHQHGRGLIVIGDQAWSRVDERRWFARPLETNLWELWADDAQHAVLDLVELAGPQVDLDEIGPIMVGEREALRVTLRASEQRHPERVVEALSPWRRQAQVHLGSATIILDRATGLWLAAQLDLSWSFRDSAGREMQGAARLDGRVELAETPFPISPPREFEALPERARPELLRQRMLDGLAAQ